MNKKDYYSLLNDSLWPDGVRVNKFKNPKPRPGKCEIWLNSAQNDIPGDCLECTIVCYEKIVNRYSTVA